VAWKRRWGVKVLEREDVSVSGPLDGIFFCPGRGPRDTASHHPSLWPEIGIGKVSTTEVAEDRRAPA
jgi:hypothetical protein